MYSFSLRPEDHQPSGRCDLNLAFGGIRIRESSESLAFGGIVFRRLSNFFAPNVSDNAPDNVMDVSGNAPLANLEAVEKKWVPDFKTEITAVEAGQPDGGSETMMEDCPVCFGETKYENGITMPKCKHWFCRSCVTTIRKGTRIAICPLCRAENHFPVLQKCDVDRIVSMLDEDV